MFSHFTHINLVNINLDREIGVKLALLTQLNILRRSGGFCELLHSSSRQELRENLL